MMENSAILVGDNRDGTGAKPIDRVEGDMAMMLSAGTTDTNGREIYEGDIVTRKCGDPECKSEHIGIVEYHSEAAQYVIVNRKEKGIWPMIAQVTKHDSSEVVGYIKPTVLGNGWEDPRLYEKL